MKSAANYAMIMSVQGHHCLFIELKLCNMIICIADKTVIFGGENWGRSPPLGPLL